MINFPNTNVNHTNTYPISIEKPNIPQENHEEMIDEELLSKQALLIARGISFPMVLKAAIELNILDLISESCAYVSASELATQIPGCVNPEAPALLDRMLNLLTSFSILNCELRSNNEVEDEVGVERVYKAAPICKYFLTKNVGSVHGSFGPLFLLHHDEVLLDSWCNFKDALLEGGSPPFIRAHGMSSFEYSKTDLRYNKVFNGAMSNHTTLVTKKILDVYRGFEGIEVMVDVGGGIGTTLDLITSKYPTIKGVNFDLHHVLVDSPIINPRVQHIGGDMFEQIPNGDVIFMKWILHDWSDEKCMKLLSNCWKALPQKGKAIIVESILSLTPESNYESQITTEQDIAMFVHNNGGKERTEEEFKALAYGSGFTDFRVICSVYNTWVMEFHKP